MGRGQGDGSVEYLKNVNYKNRRGSRANREKNAIAGRKFPPGLDRFEAAPPPAPAAPPARVSRLCLSSWRSFGNHREHRVGMRPDIQTQLLEYRAVIGTMITGCIARYNFVHSGSSPRRALPNFSLARFSKFVQGSAGESFFW